MMRYTCKDFRKGYSIEMMRLVPDDFSENKNKYSRNDSKIY